MAEHQTTMPSICDISLDTYRGGVAALAVGFLLHRPAAHSRVTITGGGWEVEVRQGSASVVARTSTEMHDEAALESAIDAANEALDIAAVSDGNILLTKRAVEEFVIYRREPKQTPTIQLLLDWPMSVGPLEITHVLADGTIERPAERLPAAWAPSFRFFRLSQASDDLFEAFEICISRWKLCSASFTQNAPASAIGTGLYEVSAKLPAQSVSHLICSRRLWTRPQALADTFYGIRVQLFHGKEGRTILPGSPVSYSSVADAYRSLAKFWRDLVALDLGAQISGGVVTHVGFRMMMENAVKGMRFAVSGDTTPASREQEHLSQSGGPVITFSSAVALAEERGGRVRVTSTEHNAGGRLGVFGRSGLVTEDSGTLVIVSDDFAPIDTNGIDDLTMRFTMRLGTPANCELNSEQSAPSSARS